MWGLPCRFDNLRFPSSCLHRKQLERNHNQAQSLLQLHISTNKRGVQRCQQEETLYLRCLMYQCALSVILQHSTAEKSAMKEVVSTFTMACLQHAYACVRSDVFDIKHRSVLVVCSTFCIHWAHVIAALIKYKSRRKARIVCHQKTFLILSYGTKTATSNKDSHFISAIKKLDKYFNSGTVKQPVLKGTETLRESDLLTLVTTGRLCSCAYENSIWQKDTGFSGQRACFHLVPFFPTSKRCAALNRDLTFAQWERKHVHIHHSLPTNLFTSRRQ